jgi:hypothetical protein
MRGAGARAGTSGLPPGATGTTQRTARFGYGCAKAFAAAHAATMRRQGMVFTARRLLEVFGKTRQLDELLPDLEFLREQGAELRR